MKKSKKMNKTGRKRTRKRPLARISRFLGMLVQKIQGKLYKVNQKCCGIPRVGVPGLNSTPTTPGGRRPVGEPKQNKTEVELLVNDWQNAWKETKVNEAKKSEKTVVWIHGCLDSKNPNNWTRKDIKIQERLFECRIIMSNVRQAVIFTLVLINYPLPLDRFPITCHKREIRVSIARGGGGQKMIEIPLGLEVHILIVQGQENHK